MKFVTISITHCLIEPHLEPFSFPNKGVNCQLLTKGKDIYSTPKWNKLLGSYIIILNCKSAEVSSDHQFVLCRIGKSKALSRQFIIIIPVSFYFVCLLIYQELFQKQLINVYLNIPYISVYLNIPFINEKYGY